MLLAPEPVCVAVEDKGREEEEPAQEGMCVRRRFGDIHVRPKEAKLKLNYHCTALTPATALISARPVSPATAARLANSERLEIMQWLLLIALPSLKQDSI